MQHLILHAHVHACRPSYTSNERHFQSILKQLACLHVKKRQFLKDQIFSIANQSNLKSFKQLSLAEKKPVFQNATEFLDM